MTLSPTTADPADVSAPDRIDGLADVERMEATPLSARRLPDNTFAMLERGAEIDPLAPALSFFLDAADFRHPVTWTFEDLLSDIRRTANALRRLGVERADVVAFVLPNLPETHLVIWGAETAGIAFAINPLLDTEQIAQLLRSGGASWLVTLAPTPGVDIWERVSAAAEQVDAVRGILTVDLARYVPEPHRAAVAALAATARRGSLPTVRPFSEVIADAPGDLLEFPPAHADDLSSYVCTGGTTGLPKIARRTHGAEVFDAWAVQPFVPEVFRPGAAVFCGLPLFHVNAQLVTGLSPWSRGAHVVLGTPQGYRGDGVLDAFWAIVEHYRISAFSGVPTVFAGLLHRPVGAHDIRSVGHALCGAAPMPEELFRAFQDRTGIQVLEAYGLTEGTCASSVNPESTSPRIGSIGLRLPYQRMAVAVLDDHDAVVRFAGVDEPGVLLISGPNVFAGYVDPTHERGVWVDADGARWVNTGDTARQDADGYFWLIGRKKEIIIRGGHNIDPKVIEEPLHEHPAVALAAAVGRPDAHAGEVPVVYVQLTPGEDASEEDLLAYAAAHIGERAAQPRSVRIVDHLPTTAVGKIFKPALVLREIEDVCRAEADRAATALSSIETVQDPVRGHVARIHASGDVARLRAALAAYTFRTEIEG